MPAERYFYHGPFSKGARVQLAENEQRHLVQVMRAHPRQQVELVNGQGEMAMAIVSQLEKKAAFLEIEQVFFEKKAPYPMILAQAVPRSNRLDFILEKGTELGMTEIWLFPGEQSEKTQISDSLLNRMQSIVISALKQCGRLYLPSIVIKPPLSSWTLQKFPIFYGDLSPEALPFYQTWSKAKYPEGFIFAIGPEKGFSNNEKKVLKSLNSQAVKLHENILRTDTASLAALSIAQHLLL